MTQHLQRWPAHVIKVTMPLVTCSPRVSDHAPRQGQCVQTQIFASCKASARQGMQCVEGGSQDSEHAVLARVGGERGVAPPDVQCNVFLT